MDTESPEVLHRSKAQVRLFHLLSSERGMRQQLEREEARMRQHIMKLDQANRHVSSVHKIAASKQKHQQQQKKDQHLQNANHQTSPSPASSLVLFASQSAIDFEAQQAAAVVDRSLQQYMAYLKDVPDRSDVETLRIERENIAAEALHTDQLNDVLRQEHHARKEYTALVLSDIKAQERERASALHASLVAAIDSRSSEIDRLVEEQHLAFAEGRQQRVERLRRQLEYVRRHGNYPRHVEEAQNKRQRAAEAEQEIAHLRRGFVKTSHGGGRKSDDASGAEERGSSPRTTCNDVDKSATAAAREAFLLERLENEQTARAAHRNRRAERSIHDVIAEENAKAFREANEIRHQRQAQRDLAKAEQGESSMAQEQKRREFMAAREERWRQRMRDEESEKLNATTEMNNRVADAASQRKAELAAERQLWQEGILALRQGFEASRLVDTVVDSMLQQRNVASFLGRMNMDDEFADEMNVLRAKRASENRQYWLDRRHAQEERRLAAAARAQSNKHNYALQCRNESLMAQEAAIVQRANIRLQKRKIVEEHHGKRLQSLRHDPTGRRTRKNVVEAMYSGRVRRADRKGEVSSAADGQLKEGCADCDHTDSEKEVALEEAKEEEEEEEVEEDEEEDDFEIEDDCDGEAFTALPANENDCKTAHTGSVRQFHVTQAHLNAEREHLERLRRRKRLPQPVPVLPPHMRRSPPSLCFPSSKNIAACTNPDIAETAARLLRLELEQQADMRVKQLAAIAHSSVASVTKKVLGDSLRPGGSPVSGNSEVDAAALHLSEARRQQAVERLTRRSVADEARSHAKMEDAKPKTFHDHLAPVVGCNLRLYSADPKTRHHDAHPQTHLRAAAHRKHPVAYWGEHFSDDAVRRHNLTLEGLQHAAVLQSTSVASQDRNGAVAKPQRSQIDVVDLVQRLASPIPSRAQSAAGNHHQVALGARRISSAAVSREKEHVDRFYTKARQRERQLAAELDSKYNLAAPLAPK
jgi:hypothetical protein